MLTPEPTPLDYLNSLLNFAQVMFLAYISARYGSRVNAAFDRGDAHGTTNGQSWEDRS